MSLGTHGWAPPVIPGSLCVAGSHLFLSYGYYSLDFKGNQSGLSDYCCTVHSMSGRMLVIELKKPIKSYENRACPMYRVISMQ